MKPETAVLVASRSASFHCRKAVAPLKPMLLFWPEANQEGFPLPKGVAPLKLDDPLKTLVIMTLVSTAERRWPH